MVGAERAVASSVDCRFIDGDSGGKLRATITGNRGQINKKTKKTNLVPYRTIIRYNTVPYST